MRVSTDNDIKKLTSEATSFAGWRSYFAVCKPKVVALIAFTALVGMLLAGSNLPSWQLLTFGIAGIALVAASGAAVNHLIDRRIDRLMARTHKRPLPSGELQPRQVLLFAIILGGAGMMALIVQVNLLTAVLTAMAFFGYAIVYTVYLKHATPYNIVWGGAAGAAPPLLGWCAATGQIELGAILLFAIIFVWTPPHFWALAIKRRRDYAKAGVPMLPVTHGVEYTKRQIVSYTVALVVITAIPSAIGMTGLVYLAGAMALGARFLWHAIKLQRSANDDNAMPTFAYSIYYLTALFALLLLDHFIA